MKEFLRKILGTKSIKKPQIEDLPRGTAAKKTAQLQSQGGKSYGE